MAFFEVTLEQNFVGQQIINRFNYESSGIAAAVTPSFALTSALGAIYDAGPPLVGYPPTGLMKRIADIQHTTVSFVSLRVINLYDFEDFYENPFVQPLTGSISSSEPLPPTSAYGFRTNVVRRDIRRGTKRFVGVPEGIQNAGTIANGTLTGGMATLATAMGATLVYEDEGQSINFQPVILGRQRYNPETGLPSDTGTAWRYYPDAPDQAEHVARSIIWQPYTTVRTQTSRQFGRGR